MISYANKKAFRPVSNFAMAIALVTGSALGITAFADTALAQKRDRDNKEEKPTYSEGFIEAYNPVQELQKAEAPDTVALSAAVPGLVEAIETADDKRAAGGMVYNIGIAKQDLALQRQGLDLMIDSGKIPAADSVRFIVTAGQLASDAGDQEAARARFEQAIAAGYTGTPALEGVIAESYFKENRYAEGLAYLKGAVDTKLAAGEMPDEDWLKRGVAMSYTNDLGREAVIFSTEYARLYPSKTSWGDAIAIQRTYFDYNNNAMLDLLRLADRTGSLRDGRDYADYIEAADARRLPGEVKRVIDMGVGAGLLELSDPFVSDASSTANERLRADRADLPALERDARAASSTALTATAAGDAFLSYGMAAKAEEMYAIALTKSGADMPRVLTRLGISQSDQGKGAEAAATFAKVEGVRSPIALLWGIHAEQSAAAAQAPVGTATDAAM